MSYHFRPVLTYFDPRGTTLSYFLGSSRTEKDRLATRLCGRADRHYGPDRYQNRSGMGTTIARTRKDGSKAFVAQIVIKKAGAIVHREAETFDGKQAANAWIVKREAELKRPGGLEQKEDPSIAAVINRYARSPETPSSARRPRFSRRSKIVPSVRSNAATSQATDWYHSRVS